MPHAARDEPMLIFTREFAAIARGFRMGRAIRVAFEGNGGRGDDRTFGEPLFQIAGIDRSMVITTWTAAAGWLRLIVPVSTQF